MPYVAVRVLTVGTGLFMQEVKRFFRKLTAHIWCSCTCPSIFIQLDGRQITKCYWVKLSIYLNSYYEFAAFNGLNHKLD